MRQKIKKAYINHHLDEENIKKYEHVLEKRAENDENLKVSMINHLSALNDGVIAIFITVMMLEIPFPTSKATYMGFVWSVLVFLVSFFIIAGFWYDNKRIFESIIEADHIVIVTNFMFLASLALIPVVTKWILNQNDRYAAMNFGAVYLLTTFFQELLHFAAVRKRFQNHTGLLLFIIYTRTGVLLVTSLVLITLSWFCPQWAIMLYILLPIISFFKPIRIRSKG